MKPHITVISLRDAADRHKSVRKQMGAAGVHDFELKLFERFAGESHPNYDPKARLAKFGYALLNGEIGCFDSHRRVWKEASRRSEPTLILEDDFSLIDPEGFALSELVCTEEACVVRLHGIFEKQLVELDQICNRSLVSYEGNPAGTLAYVVSPKAADVLYQESERFFVPVDDFIDQEWRHGLIVQGLVPYPFQATGDDSCIGERKKPKFSVVEKARIEFFKGLESLKSRRFKAFKKRRIAQYKSADPEGRVLNRR